LLESAAPQSAEKAAEHLLATFGSLPRLFAADAHALIKAASDRTIERLLLSTKAVIDHATRVDRTAAFNLEHGGAAVVRHLWQRMAFLDVECVRVLFFTRAGTLLADQEVARGDSGHATLDPRIIIRRALELGAHRLVLAHNHPSGDPTPSQSDRTATTRLTHAAGLFAIEIKDHLIVASTGWSSMRALGWLSR